MKILKIILYFLSPLERKKASLILLATILMAIIDMLGIASIMPFLLVLTNPNLIENNPILNQIYQSSSLFGIETSEQFILMLGVVVLIILIFSISSRALITYAQQRFCTMREYSIGRRLLEGYLHQPYHWFLNRNSTELGKTILSEVGLIVSNGLVPMITLISQCLITIALIALLLFVDLRLTLTIVFVISSVYIIIFKFTRSFLSNTGKERLDANNSRFMAINEAFGAIKEIKMRGLEKIFINDFSNPSITYIKHQANLIIISKLPRYAIEIIAFGGMLLLTLYIFSKTGIFSEAIPIIALYAFVGYRLLPAIQEIYQAAATLKFYSSGINSVYEEFKNLKLDYSNNERSVIVFNKVINLKNIYYTYPNSAKVVLKDISLTIPCKQIVGIIGATGSGKTTLVDIISGVLDPQKGSLEVDNKIIGKKNIKSWQQLIGYVPQKIYLSDTTISNNIAFGVDRKNINQEAVERAAKIANLHEFIINELPEKYETTVGERGIRLSGGQCQRIGIARAVYNNPQLLIFDEATSALDNMTEHVILEAIKNLRNKITIILIAHRLNTVKNCNTIFLLEKGKLVLQGKYDDLKRQNKIFL